MRGIANPELGPWHGRPGSSDERVQGPVRRAPWRFASVASYVQLSVDRRSASKALTGDIVTIDPSKISFRSRSGPDKLTEALSRHWKRYRMPDRDHKNIKQEIYSGSKAKFN